MKNFKGIIIEESLENKDILQKIKIVKTNIEKVTEEHETPWIKQWTLHDVEISENEVDEIAEEISKCLDSKDDWYSDFKNDHFHYIIFRNKIFKIDKLKPEGYEKVVKYGISLGIPNHQLDFIPD